LTQQRYTHLPRVQAKCTAAELQMSLPSIQVLDCLHLSGTSTTPELNQRTQLIMRLW
jgi:uncharacterized protein YceH (UPF0502 family)